jgi:3-oxoacyl-[acyl-carrier-protein] synthase-3
VQIQAALGITKGVAFDLQAVCSGFVFALSPRRQIPASGLAQARAGHRRRDLLAHSGLEDRTTCVLFGDGAGAMVLEAQADDGSLRPNGFSDDAICAPTAAIAKSSTSMAAPRPPRPSATCA